MTQRYRIAKGGRLSVLPASIRARAFRHTGRPISLFISRVAGVVICFSFAGKPFDHTNNANWSSAVPVLGSCDVKSAGHLRKRDLCLGIINKGPWPSCVGLSCEVHLIVSSALQKRAPRSAMVGKLLSLSLVEEVLVGYLIRQEQEMVDFALQR